MSNRIWLSPPHMSGKEMKYIEKAFETNWIAPQGSNVTKFEKDIEEYLGLHNRYVACLSSGTAAIHLALILSGVDKGDEVICQSFTFSASANPILYQGAKPIFIDSEEETWNMCPLALELAIEDRIKKGKKPKAIIVVHLYGMPAKIGEISNIAEKYQITLIEDAAEALGSKFKGQQCGTYGDFGILSFNGNKIITTSGGGALITNKKEIKDRAVFLATQARDTALHYQHSTIGYNYRMSNVLAGIGCGQMEVLDDHINSRRVNHCFYQQVFANVNGIKIFSETNQDYYSNHWLSCIVIDEQVTGFNRENIRLALERENIESKPLWKPMHMQPVFRNSFYYGGIIAETLFKKGLCLPSGSNLTDPDKQRIKKVLELFIT